MDGKLHDRSGQSPCETPRVVSNLLHIASLTLLVHRTQFRRMHMSHISLAWRLQQILRFRSDRLSDAGHCMTYLNLRPNFHQLASLKRPELAELLRVFTCIFLGLLP